jgi:branched-chain amino acid transport system permease protein
LVQILVYGAVISAIYAMLAVGFTLIFGVARILNLAHGSFYALGAYAAYTFTAVAHLPLWLAFVLAVLFVAAFGMAMERVLVRPLRRSSLAVLLITLAVALMVEQMLLLVFGSEARNVPSMVNATYHFAGVDISSQRLLALVGAILILASLWLFMQHTRLGSAILAISQDAEAAQYMGIPSDRIYSIVMGLSAGIAAAAGILVAPFQTVIPGMGLLPLIKAFAIVVVGGERWSSGVRTERWRDRRERSEVRGLRQQPARNRTDTGGSDDASMQALFFYWGPPRSGKGTILRVMTKLIGALNTQHPSIHTLAGRFGLEGCIGKSLIQITDMDCDDPKALSTAASKINAISGQDNIAVERKGIGDWNGLLPGRIVMAGNNLPNFGSHAAATAARLLIFPFDVTFLGTERDA